MNKPLNPDKFWQFSCVLYEVDSVKELCLYWQEEYGLNVNLLLLCVWLQNQRVNIEEELFLELLEALRDTDVQLQKLRIHRRKENKESPVYKELLANELEIEAKQQGDLVGRLNALCKMPVNPDAAIKDVVDNYLTMCGIPTEDPQLAEFKEILKKNEYF